MGTLEQIEAPPAPDPVTFAEAVKHFRATHMRSALKPTTRIGYNVQLNTLLLPRFGAWPLEAIHLQALAVLKSLMRQADLDAILDAASPTAKLAFHLATLAGLRAGEVRGLW